MVIPRFRWSVSVVVASAIAATGASACIRRSDLSERWPQLGCFGQPAEEELRRRGIYDASILGELVTDRPAAGRGGEICRQHGYGGWASGRCPDGRYWVVATPAAKPLVLEPSGEWRLPIKALKAQCVAVTAAYTSAKGGVARELLIRSSRVTLPAGAGTLSVICQPHDRLGRGPVTVFLASTGGAEKVAVPDLSHLSEVDPGENLILWINRLRRREGLRELAMSEALHREALAMSQGAQLAHDRRRTRAAAATLGAQGVRLIGENRVLAADEHRAAELLWRSPTHRSLLLRPEARRIGAGVSFVGGQQSVVLLVGGDG